MGWNDEHTAWYTVYDKEELSEKAESLYQAGHLEEAAALGSSSAAAALADLYAGEDAEKAAYWNSIALAEGYVNNTVTAEVTSTLYGTAYTNGKSTLKKELGDAVSYDENGKAVITLKTADGSAVDNAKIDASNAVVTIGEGDGYLPENFEYNGDQLKGAWSNGSYTLTLDSDDILPTNGDYPVDNGGREWSALGSDGKGLYYINLNITGLEYDGKVVDPISVRVNVQIYGYDYTTDALELYPDGVQEVTNEQKALSDKPAVDDTPVFTWVGDGEEPILCDDLADNFYISWPEGMDASSLSEDDITITMYSRYGDSLTIDADGYDVFYTDQETQIGVNYQYWAFAPVYTTMTISVNADAVSGLNSDLEKTYAIDSVYVNGVQTGGGFDRDRTVVVFQYLGYDNFTDYKQIGLAPSYVLVSEDGKYYTSEGTLSEDKSAAMVFDASGADEQYAACIAASAYFTEIFDSDTVEKEINGETVTLTKSYNNKWPFGQGTNGFVISEGYVKGTTGLEHHKWAWMSGIDAGWTAINITPMEGRYTYTVPKGTSLQFSADVSNVTWSVVGAKSSDTKVSSDGTLTVGADESTDALVLTCVDSDGNRGAITIYYE